MTNPLMSMTAIDVYDLALDAYDMALDVYIRL